MSSIDNKGDLQTTFEENRERVNNIEYRHPKEDKLLPELEDKLLETPTGTRLLKSIKSHNIPIRLIKGEHMHGFSIEGKAVYVSLLHNLSEINPRLTLELVAALRSAEQDVMGYGNPDQVIEPIEFAALNHAKNLDLVVHMCRMAHEYFESTQQTDYIDVLETMGHKGLYDAFSRNFASDDLVDVYYGQDA